MIIAIERNRFTYLYKYNQVKVEISQVLDDSVENLKSTMVADPSHLISIFNNLLPVFELDHEILLLEVNKDKILIKDGIILFFDAVISIFPLSSIAEKMLAGKISNDFFINEPVFELVIEKLKLVRSLENRKSAVNKLISVYSLKSRIENKFIDSLEDAVLKNLPNEKGNKQFITYLDHLVGYNYNPRFIPDGNVEHICKIGLVASFFIGNSEEIFMKGPFYKSCLKYHDQIKKGNIEEGYLIFTSIKDEDFKNSYNKIVKKISEGFEGIDIFKISYFFLSYRAYLNKNENNLTGLDKSFKKLIVEDEKVAVFVLTMLGYVFSFELLYESLHLLGKAPLLKSITSRATHIEEDEEKYFELKVPGNSKKQKTRTTTGEEAIFDFDDPQGITTPEFDIIDNSINLNLESVKFSEKIENPLFDHKVITIQDFKDWIVKNHPKQKKVWFEFLDANFTDNDDSIDLKKISIKIANNHTFLKRLSKQKEVMESIRSFFELKK